MLKYKFLIQNALKKYFKWSTFFVLTGIFYSFGYAINMDLDAQREIDEFKSRATFEYQLVRAIGDQNETIRYYSVSRETVELDDLRNVFYDESRQSIGQEGDVIVTQQSPFPYIPVIGDFISYYFGGHAAILNDQNQLYEATGISSGGDSIIDVILHPGDQEHDFGVTAVWSYNYWLDPNRRTESSLSYPYYGTYNRTEFLALRVSDITESERKEAVEYAKNVYELGYLYNYLYFLDMAYKFYCTDIISRAYQSAIVPDEAVRQYSTVLNDRFITSVNDLIVDEQTYITVYVEIIDHVIHVYYLEDVQEGN
jgi:hypothetical protein